MTDMSLFFNGLLETAFALALLAGVIGGGLFGYFLATRSAPARQRTFRGLVGLLVLGGIGGGLYAVKIRRDHIVWPRRPIPWVQDLPPVGKSAWPKTPVAWSNETVTVQVATPDGLKSTKITYYINSIGMKFVRIEPGTFMMGLTDQQARRLVAPHHPLHRVTLTKPYYLCAFETANRDYERFDPGHKKHRPFYQRKGRESWNSEEHPVEPVTWQDAMKFCRWLSAKEGRQYRLPTEAEWEYACKAGTETRLYWGDAYWDGNKANVGGLKWDHETWINDGYEYTAPVGTYPPNPWGLYDMIGNSWEWCQDWYSRLTADPAVDPHGPLSGHFRVYKGGNWGTRLYSIKAVERDGDDPADIPDIRGFRVACDDGTPASDRM
jgi:formylglycine-generating enzyme required for sulfatase activity